MKKEVFVALFVFLSISSISVHAVETISFTAFEENETLSGYSFEKREFVDIEDADFYVVKEDSGETITFYIKSSIDSIANKGKEDVTDFICDDIPLSDYSVEERVYEKQGYCILTDEDIYKLYIISTNTQSFDVDIRWIIHEQTTESINLVSEQAESNSQGDGGGGEGEGGGAGGGAGGLGGLISAIFDKDEPMDEDKDYDSDEDEETTIKKIIKQITQTIKDNKEIFIAIIVILLIYSILSIIWSYKAKKWRQKHKLVKK